MIYETKGLSLEQVDEMYGVIDKAWKSKTFVPQVNFADIENDKQKRQMSLTDITATLQEERRRSVKANATVPGERQEKV